MRSAHKKLLEILEGGDFSLKELVEITGYSSDGIRGRLSEMNKLGHRIERLNGKYHLVSTKIKNNVKINVKRIFDFVEKYRLYGHRVHIEKLMIGLNLSHGEVSEALGKIHQRGQLLQWKKDIVIVYRI